LYNGIDTVILSLLLGARDNDDDDDDVGIHDDDDNDDDDILALLNLVEVSEDNVLGNGFDNRAFNDKNRLLLLPLILLPS